MLTLLGTLRAQEERKPFTWVGNDGIFSDEKEWDSNIPPGPLDAARFVQNGDLTIRFQEDASFARLLVEGTAANGEPTVLCLDLGGHTVDLGENGGIRGRPLSIQSYIRTGVRTLAVRNGELQVPGFSLGVSQNDTTEKSVIRLEKQCRLVTNSYVSIGNIGAGEVLVNDGAEWKSTGYLRLGMQNGASGLLKVQGRSARLSTLAEAPPYQSIICIAGEGCGTMEISDGGQVEAFIVQLGRGMAEKPAETGQGVLSVEGAGSNLNAQQLFVGGGKQPETSAAIKDGNGTATFASQATATLDYLCVFEGSTLAADLSAVVDVNSAAFELGSTFRVLLSPRGKSLPLTVETLSIEGARLEIAGEGRKAALKKGDVIGILKYTGSREGEFSGLKSGALVKGGGYSFVIDYGNSANSSISLKVVGAP